MQVVSYLLKFDRNRILNSKVTRITSNFYVIYLSFSTRTYRNHFGEANEMVMSAPPNDSAKIIIFNEISAVKTFEVAKKI